MPMWEIYAEMARDFEQRTKQVTQKAKNSLSIYPYDFDEEILHTAVRSILRQHEIDAYVDVSESRWKEILNEKTLFDAILAYYFSVFDQHILRQIRWLDANDVPTDEKNINERKNFLHKLYTIRNKAYESNTIEQAIRFKLEQVAELSDIITKTDLNILTDRQTLTIIDVLSSLLTFFCMSIFAPLYYDPIVDNKCSMAHSWSTLWSGQSLNNVHMQQLKVKAQQLEDTSKMVNQCLTIQQNESVDKALLQA